MAIGTVPNTRASFDSIRVCAFGRATIHEPLVATGGWIEGRYKIHPRVYAAARFDHLGFSALAGTTRTADWEAPVTRIELGGGFLLQRNLQLKASFQRNTRDGGRVTHLKIGSAQLVFWF
jgi:hypothetical protein